HSPREHRDPPSFPTRRSSDLNHAGRPAASGAGLHRSRHHSSRGASSRKITGTPQAASTAEEGQQPANSSQADIVRPAHSTRADRDRKSTRLNSSHVKISYAVF